MACGCWVRYWAVSRVSVGEGYPQRSSTCDRASLTPSGTPQRDRPGSLGSPSEVHSDLKLDEPRLDDAQRVPPGDAVVLLLRQNGVRVERVVQIDVQVDRPLAGELED